jgi:hypothetical protein
MRRLKVLGLALMAVLVVGVMTAAAASAESSPLPDIHTALPGEKYPLLFSGHQTGTSELVNESGGVLKGTEFSILLKALELTSLGEATIDFYNVGNSGGEQCNTPGDAPGVVLIPNAEYHLVYTSLSPAAPLELAGLVLFTKFALTCGGVFEITVTGPFTMRISVPKPEAGKEGDSTSLETAWHCGSLVTAIQEISYYYNDAFTQVPTTLLANFAGTGNKKACEEIEGTTLLTPETGSTATMFSVLF